MAMTPALLVVVIPGVLGVMEGRKAIRVGRPDGRLPAVIGVVIGTAFVALDLQAFALG